MPDRARAAARSRQLTESVIAFGLAPAHGWQSGRRVQLQVADPYCASVVAASRPRPVALALSHRSTIGSSAVGRQDRAVEPVRRTDGRPGCRISDCHVRFRRVGRLHRGPPDQTAGRPITQLTVCARSTCTSPLARGCNAMQDDVVPATTEGTIRAEPVHRTASTLPVLMRSSCAGGTAHTHQKKPPAARAEHERQRRLLCAEGNVDEHAVRIAYD